MWWPTQARSPFATQKVFFSSAPQASTCRAAGTGSGRLRGHVPARAAQHQRRRAARAHDPHDRVVGAGLDRAVVEQEQVGDPGQPLDARRRRGRRSARRRRCRSSSRAARAGVGAAAGGAAASRAASRRARASAGATAARHARAGRAAQRARSAAPARASSSLLLGSSSHELARRPSTSATISANGLSSRCLRARSARHGASSSARQARW